MKQEIKDIMERLLKRHKELGISDQIDYEKFYLYSIITHSTAIGGYLRTEFLGTLRTGNHPSLGRWKRQNKSSVDEPSTDGI